MKTACLSVFAALVLLALQTDDEIAKRARDLHESALVLDAHIDTTLRLTRADWDFTREHEPMPAGISSHPESQSQAGHADLPRMRKGGLDALFFGVVVRHASDVPVRGPITGPQAVHDALVQIAAVHKLAEDLPNDVVFSTKADEVRAAQQQGRIAALIGVEGGHMINNSLPILREFARLGVRYMTLTHFYHTDWADSSGEQPSRHNGLTGFGREIVREMNRLAMVVDISHVSDKTFQDALDVSLAPMIASHSSSRSIAGHVRNMSDEMIKALAAKGGVVAVNFHVPYLDQARNDYQTRIQPLMTRLIAQYPGEQHEMKRQAEVAREHGPAPPVSWQKIVEHIDHVVRLAGADHVAIGSDFDGAAMPEGMEDVTKLPRITEALLRKGYSESDIRKILGGNLLRVMADAERVAAQSGSKTARGAASQQPSRPNILFAIADDWSFGHASAYGAPWVRTPAFDRVAREGLLFTRAYTPNAKCAPSRAILLTGRHSWQLEEAANHVPFFPAKFKSWVEALGEGGYFTGMTGKGWGPGVASDPQGKPRQMTGRPFGARKAAGPAGGMAPNDYAANFADFLDAAPEGRPWSFWYGASEPHRGYEYGSGVAKGKKKLSDIDRVPGYWPDNDVVRNDMLDYAYEVEHFDRHLARMLELLDKRGLLDDTLVVVTSDHGMPFPRAKGQAYDFSNHVPLAVMWPRGIAAKGRVVRDYVSFVDLASTFIDLAGLKWSATGMQPTAGRSLTDILFSGTPGRATLQRDHVLVGKERHDVGRPHDWGYPIRGIIKDEALYLRNYEPSRWPAGDPETGYLNTDGSPTKTDILQARREGRGTRFWDLAFGKRMAEELYDLKQDPHCLTNLADDPRSRKRRDELRQLMEQELRAQGDPRQSGKGEIFDRYVYADETTRNFYERFMRGETLKAGWVSPSDFEKAPIK